MKLSMIPKYNLITIDAVSLKCDYEVAPNIEAAFFDTEKKKGKIQYNDKTKNKVLTEMPHLETLELAFWTAYSVKFLPSAYHSWDMVKKEFFITPENQQKKTLDEHDKANSAAFALTARENKKTALKNNPITSLSIGEVAEYVNTTDEKELLVNIVKLLVLITK